MVHVCIDLITLIMVLIGKVCVCDLVRVIWRHNSRVNSLDFTYKQFLFFSFASLVRPKVRYIFSAEIPEAMNEGVKFHCVYVPPLITLYMFHHHVSHTFECVC